MSSLAMVCLGLWASSFILSLYGTRRALKTLKPRSARTWISSPYRF